MEKVKNALNFLRNQGGKIDVIYTETVISGNISFKVLGGTIQGSMVYNDGEASIRISKLPFFVTEDMVARYILSHLE